MCLLLEFRLASVPVGHRGHEIIQGVAIDELTGDIVDGGRIVRLGRAVRLGRVGRLGCVGRLGRAGQPRAKCRK